MYIHNHQRYVFDRWVQSKEFCGMSNGPTILDESGKLSDTKGIDDMLIDLWIECYHEYHNLFDVYVNNPDKMATQYCY